MILYTNNCPNCFFLKRELDKKGIQYEICDDVDLMLEKGFRSMPMLEKDGEIMIFPKALEWVKGV